MIIERERNIIFEGVEDKPEFYLFINSIVQLISHDEYLKLVDVGDEETPQTIAWLECKKGEVLHSIEDIDVYVNQDKFLPFRQNLQILNQLFQVVIRHEAAELWYISGLEQSTEYDKDSEIGNGFAHKMALLEEWRLAFELECENEYMVCIRYWAQEIAKSYGEKASEEFLNENIQAFEAIFDERFYVSELPNTQAA